MEMGRSNLKVFEIFAMHFVSGVIKYQTWKDCGKRQKFSHIVNESDEAMAFLILANNWDVWVNQCGKNPDGSTVKVRDSISKQKYMEKDGGRGYSFNPAGRRYFNERYDFAQNDRDIHGDDFDNYLFETLTKKSNEEALNSKKNKYKEEPEAEIQCRNGRSGKARKITSEAKGNSANLHLLSVTPEANRLLSVTPEANRLLSVTPEANQKVTVDSANLRLLSFHADTGSYANIQPTGV